MKIKPSWIFIFFAFWQAQALASSFTYEGYLTDANDEPIGAVVPMKFEIYGVNGSECLLYSEEQQVSVDKGHFAARVGGPSASNIVLYGGTPSLSQIFIEKSLTGKDGCTSPPGSERALMVTVDGVSMGRVRLTSAPRAMVAERVGGHAVDSLLRLESSGSPQPVSPLSGADYAILQQLFAGALPGTRIDGDITGSAGGFTGSLSGDVTGTQGATQVSRLLGHSLSASASCGDGQILKLSSGEWACAADATGSGGGGSGGTVTSLTAGSGLSASPSTITTTGTLSLATSGVDSTHLKDGAVTTAKIVDGAVTLSKLGAPNGGQFLKFNAGSWSGANILFGDIKNSLGNSAFNTVSCTASQTVKWSSLTDTFECQSIGSLDASTITSGTIAAARLPAFTGDATSSVGSTALTLQDTGVSAGTYSKVTVDTKGRVTVGSNLAPSEITSALGFVPVSKTGDSMTGTLSLPQNGLVAGTNQLVLANGNVGIGTTSPKAKLQVAGGIQVTNGAGTIAHDVFQQNGSDAALTGTIKITMPNSWSTNMMRVRINGYNYGSSTGAWSVIISGYNYAVSSAWFNVGAQVEGRPPFSQVRLGHDGTKNVILLGDTATSTSYLKINIAEVETYHSNNDVWSSGWSVAQITDETGITSTNVPITSWRNFGTSTSFMAGNVGIGTVTPTSKLEVAGRFTVSSSDGNAAGWLESSGESGAANKLVIHGSRGVGGIVFQTNSAERARIDASGNVGIGTTSPQTTLDVNGKIRGLATLSGSVYANASSTTTFEATSGLWTFPSTLKATPNVLLNDIFLVTTVCSFAAVSSDSLVEFAISIHQDSNSSVTSLVPSNISMANLKASNGWTSLTSQGIYRAIANGPITMTPAIRTNQQVYISGCSIIAHVIGK